MCRPLLLTVLLLVLLTPPPAEALSTASAHATLDWTGFTFSTTGTLAVTKIDQATQDGAAGASATPTTPAGMASAKGSSVNAFLDTSAVAATLLADEWSMNVGTAHASATSVFWLYGTGVGSLVVTVPYHLEVTSLEDDAAHDLTAASASVHLMLGPGVGWDAMDSLSLLDGGALSRDGVLSLSKDFVNPTWGPLTGIWATAQVEAIASVPEPASALLFLFGLAGVATHHRWWTVCARHLHGCYARRP